MASSNHCFVSLDENQEQILGDIADHLGVIADHLEEIIKAIDREP